MKITHILCSLSKVGIQIRLRIFNKLFVLYASLKQFVNNIYRVVDSVLTSCNYLYSFLRYKIMRLNLVLMAMNYFLNLLVDFWRYIAGIVHTVICSDPSAWIKVTLHSLFPDQGRLPLALNGVVNSVMDSVVSLVEVTDSPSVDFGAFARDSGRAQERNGFNVFFTIFVRDFLFGRSEPGLVMKSTHDFWFGELLRNLHGPVT
jgi:hypothetical protein